MIWGGWTRQIRKAVFVGGFEKEKGGLHCIKLMLLDLWGGS